MLLLVFSKNRYESFFHLIWIYVSNSLWNTNRLLDWRWNLIQQTFPLFLVVTPLSTAISSSLTILLNEIVIPVMALMQLLWKMPLKSSSPMMAKMMMRNMTSNMMLKRGIIAMMIALITICKPEVIWCSWSLITASWNFERFSLGIDERRRRGLKTRNARSDFTLRPCHRKHVNVIKPRFKKKIKKYHIDLS